MLQPIHNVIKVDGRAIADVISHHIARNANAVDGSSGFDGSMDMRPGDLRGV